MLPREQVLDMLDLANDQKFYDLGTVAVQAAEHENELMLESKPVQPPERYEEHIVHWQSHVKFIQTRSFKEDVPPEIKELYFDHIAAHEYFMLEKTQEPTVSPVFVQKLQALEGLPLFMLVRPPQMGMAPEAGMPLSAPPEQKEASGPPPTEPPPIDDTTAPEPTDTGETPPEQQALDAAQVPPEETLPPSASKSPFPMELR
jgi:hypothetical protein